MHLLLEELQVQQAQVHTRGATAVVVVVVVAVSAPLVANPLLRATPPLPLLAQALALAPMKGASSIASLLTSSMVMMIAWRV